MDYSIIEVQSEYEKLMEEIHRLQSRIISLTALRDDLLYHVCPALEAEYEEKIASLERELVAAYMYLNMHRRTIELLQAQINNRRKKISVEEAEKQAQEEYREAQEDLNKKAEEARKNKERWEQESSWSKYDQQEEQSQKKGEEKTESRKGNEASGFSREQGSSDGDRESGEEEWERMGREDADSEEADPNDAEKGDNVNESTSMKIKRLYRKIVKRLHPDMHPNPTEHEKELLNRAHEAYKNGDLEALEAIWKEISSMDAPEETYQDTPEDIERLKEVLKQLKILCKALIQHIQKIKGEFPYTMKAFLEDEEAVAQKRFELSGELSDVREMCDKLVDEINRLRWELEHEGN